MPAAPVGTPIRTGFASVTGPSTGNVATAGSLVAGDVIAVWVRTANTAPPWTVPANWINPLGGTTVSASDTHSVFVIYHVVTAAEQAANTVSWTLTGLFSVSQTGATYSTAVRGSYLPAIVDIFGSAANAASTTTHILAGVTPTRDNSLVLSCVTGDGSATYATAPGGWTFQVKNVGGQNSGALLSLNALTVANVAVSAANITAGSGGRYASITLAFAALSNAAQFHAMF